MKVDLLTSWCASREKTSLLKSPPKKSEGQRASRESEVTPSFALSSQQFPAVSNVI